MSILAESGDERQQALWGKYGRALDAVSSAEDDRAAAETEFGKGSTQERAAAAEVKRLVDEASAAYGAYTQYA